VRRVQGPDGARYRRGATLGAVPSTRKLLTAVLATLLAVGCAGESGARRQLEGTVVEVVGVWEGAEAASFRAVLDRFGEQTGATARFTSTEGADIGDVLDQRLDAGTPPDVALLPLPGLLRDYARAGAIRPLDELVGAEVADRYGEVWQELGTVDGSLYGVWFKAAHKSLVWYDVAAFEQLGAIPPDDVDGLLRLARDLRRSGRPPFAVGAADAWTLTDWFENLYLRTAGPDRYDELAGGRRPWTDPTVHDALDLFARLLAPRFVAGGPDGALDTTFPESIDVVFGTPPGAAMLGGGDFVGGFISARTDAVLGVDADVFVFPATGDSGRLVVGGGDAAVLMRDSAGGEALIRYLASPEAAEVWAGRGGFLSPNEDVDISVYPDDRSRRIARSLLEAGDSFRFDLSDQQPVRFGGTTGAGMLLILQEFLEDPSDVEGTAARLEQAARTGR
jgi:alpha-glucoside transport system substrate-binding protein